MSDEPTIQPALTGEEWGAQRCDDLAWLEQDNSAGGFIRKGDMAIVSESGRVSYYGEESRHVIAALCLHQQPFGFTNDDAGLLEEVVARAGASGDRTLRDAANALRARIAALLPPTP